MDRLNVGERIDARDTEFIWCEAEVRKVFYEGGKPSFILIHYQGWNSIYDEIIDRNSERLAKRGFYTSRVDIPRYDMPQQSHDSMHNYVIIGQPITHPPAGTLSISEEGEMEGSDREENEGGMIEEIRSESLQTDSDSEGEDGGAEEAERDEMRGHSSSGNPEDEDLLGMKRSEQFVRSEDFAGSNAIWSLQE